MMQFLFILVLIASGILAFYTSRFFVWLTGEGLAVSLAGMVTFIPLGWLSDKQFLTQDQAMVLMVAMGIGFFVFCLVHVRQTNAAWRDEQLRLRRFG